MSKTISELWNNSKETFEGKSLQQILTFCGDGRLRDGNNTSEEFRSFLKLVPSDLLETYVNR